MPARPPAALVWRRPLGPALISGLFTMLLVAPVTYTLFYGALPPFWGGASRGIFRETGYALGILLDIVRNGLIGMLHWLLPMIPRRWMTGDWIAVLREQGTGFAYLFRLGATLCATTWVAVLIGARTYRRTGRIQGFEWVSGPRLVEGWNAVRLANAAMARESAIPKNSLRLAFDLSFSRAREVLSLAFIGGQGSGKTTVLKFLLRQLVNRAHTKIILLDQKGDLTAGWPSEAILFAPHDRRTMAWDIGRDVSEDIAAQEFAATLIPTGNSDPVWARGAQQVLEAVIVYLQKKNGVDWGFAELLEALQSPPAKLRALVGDVRPETLSFLATENNGEFTRTAIGFIVHIQAAVTPLIRPLALSWGQLPASKRVSLRSWLHDSGALPTTLILQNNTDLATISQAWLQQVIQRLVKISGSAAFPEDPDRRLWFIFDEFPQLGKMSDLLRIPETHRSKGATLVLTAQSISQIYSIYGREDADTLINLMQTKVILKPGQGSELVARMNEWVGKLRWRDPAESGVTENGNRVPITVREEELLSADYMSTLGPEAAGITGLVTGVGPDVFRLLWPYQNWPTQRPGVRLASWAKP